MWFSVLLSCGLLLLREYYCCLCTTIMLNPNFATSGIPVRTRPPLTLLPSDVSSSTCFREPYNYHSHWTYPVRYSRRQLFQLRPPRSTCLPDDLFDVLRHLGLLRRRRGTAAGSRVDRPRRIPVVLSDVRPKAKVEPAAARMPVLKTVKLNALKTTLLAQTIPSLYVINAAALSKPHAVEQL